MSGANVVTSYLNRIGYEGSREPTAATLRELHERHLFTVPFENLDIHIGRPIQCDVEQFYDKIVNRRRGGFCYELNGLFAELLRDLGFRVTMLSGRVPNSAGELGPEFDHMALVVRTEKERWLADVGFGDCFLNPLNIDSQEPQKDPAGSFTLESNNGDWSLIRDGKLEYVFTLIPRELPEFAPMCHYQQTSPDSSFTKKRVCSRATPSGRVTVTHEKIIITENGFRSETALDNESAWHEALESYFGIVLQ